MIRPAGQGDVGTILAIEQACFAEAAWSEKLICDEVLSERHVVLLSEDEQAYGAIAVVGEDTDLDRIAVLPGSRGHGRARDLLEALIDRARDLGAGRMLLEVAADNVAAIGLYESFGFDTISTRRGYYGGIVDALVMEVSIAEWR